MSSTGMWKDIHQINMHRSDLARGQTQPAEGGSPDKQSTAGEGQRMALRRKWLMSSTLALLPFNKDVPSAYYIPGLC